MERHSNVTGQKVPKGRPINEDQFSSSKGLVIEGYQHYPIKHGGKVRD